MSVFEKPGSMPAGDVEALRSRVDPVFPSPERRKSTESLVNKHFAEYVISTYGAVFDRLILEGAETFEDFIKAVQLRGSRRTTLKNQGGWKPKDYWMGFAAFDVVFDEVPRGRDVTLEAIASTVGFINEELLQRGTGRPQTRELIYLHYATMHEEWIIAQHLGPRCKRNALRSLNSHLVFRGEKPWIRTYQVLDQLLEAWQLPWIVFHSLIKYHWFYEEHIQSDK